MAGENKEFENLAEELKGGLNDIAKKLNATLAEERETFEKMVEAKADGKAFSELQEKLARLETAHNDAQKAYDEELAKLKMEASDSKASDQEAEIKSAFFDVLRTGSDAVLNEKSKGLLVDTLHKHYNDCNDQKKSVEQIKSMLSGIDTTGGVLVVPPFLEASILNFARENVFLYNAAAKTTISGDTYRRDARITRAGASWAGESDTWAETTTPQYGQIEIVVNKLIAYPTISRDLIEDSRINMEAEIMDFTQEAYSDQISLAMVSGTGKRQPKGLLSYPAVKESKVADNFGSLGYVVTGAASDFVADPNKPNCLIDLQGILKSAYGARANWLMNRSTGTAVRKFKDSEGNYMWQPALVAGQPAQLLGMPVQYDENMPDIAANSFPIALGDFTSGLLVVNRRGMTVIRDLISKPGHIKYQIDMRMGAGVRNFEAIKLLKVAAS